MAFKVKKSLSKNVKSPTKGDSFGSRFKRFAQGVNDYIDKADERKIDYYKKKTKRYKAESGYYKAKRKAEKERGRGRGGLGFDDSFFPKGL